MIVEIKLYFDTGELLYRQMILHVEQGNKGDADFFHQPPIENGYALLGFTFEPKVKSWKNASTQSTGIPG